MQLPCSLLSLFCLSPTTICTMTATVLLNFLLTSVHFVLMVTLQERSKGHQICNKSPENYMEIYIFKDIFLWTKVVNTGSDLCITAVTHEGSGGVTIFVHPLGAIPNFLTMYFLLKHLSLYQSSGHRRHP